MGYTAGYTFEYQLAVFLSNKEALTINRLMVIFQSNMKKTKQNI